MTTLFERAEVFDGSTDHRFTADVLVDDGLITAVSRSPLTVGPEVARIDATGRTLMPGLIDAHVHAFAWHVNLTRAGRQPQTYLGIAGARFLEGCLDRGFTTVRDVGGADVGLASALRDGLLHGARLIYGGHILSQTGGHGDMRPGDHELHDGHFCGCPGTNDALGILVDGVDPMRRAVREELRRGASHIKIMGSGGVASPTDPLDRCQFSDDEILAAVDEATRVGKYVAAHCHPDIAIRRCVELGVRSIEHATMIEPETADIVAAHGAYTVPTLAIMFAILEDGERLGFPAVSMEKMRRVQTFALRGLETMSRAGVRMGFGTDLLGDLQPRQGMEFGIRAEVLTPIEILRSATSVNAELMGLEGEIGRVMPGLHADLLLVDGNPLEDVKILGDPGRMITIMQRGRLHKGGVTPSGTPS